MDSQTRQCIGRFQMTLPEGMAVSGRSQAIYRVDVKTIPLPAAGVKGLWDEQLARIGKLRAPAGEKQALLRTFEVMPGAQAVLYYRDPEIPSLVAVEAVLGLSDHAVHASRGAEVNEDQRRALLNTRANEGIARLVEIVLRAYAPSTERGFCIGHGAIVTPKPAVNEDALLSLKHMRSSKLNIRLTTSTVAEPDNRTYSDLDEEKQVAEGQGAQIAVLLDQNRTVSGLAGKEMRIAVTPKKDAPFLRFTWHFAGVPGRSDQPSINVVGMGMQSEQKILEAVWDSLLGSLRPVPF